MNKITGLFPFVCVPDQTIVHFSIKLNSYQDLNLWYHTFFGYITKVQGWFQSTNFTGLHAALAAILKYINNTDYALPLNEEKSFCKVNKVFRWWHFMFLSVNLSWPGRTYSFMTSLQYYSNKFRSFSRQVEAAQNDNTRNPSQHRKSVSDEFELILELL